MILEINKKYRITTDSYNVILEELKTNKNQSSEKFGESNWVAAGYYPTFEKAIEGFVDRKIKVTEVEGVEKVLKLLKEIKKAIENLDFGKIDKE